MQANEQLEQDKSSKPNNQRTGIQHTHTASKENQKPNNKHTTYNKQNTTAAADTNRIKVKSDK